MRISYDPEVDAMYIALVEGDHECRTVRLTDQIALDFGDRETLVGIEILDAKKVLGRGKLPKVIVDNLTLSAAGRMREREEPKTSSRQRVRKAG